MSHRILHLTQADGEAVAVKSSSIQAVVQNGCETILYLGSGAYSIREPYDQVLRLGSDALSDQF